MNLPEWLQPHLAEVVHAAIIVVSGETTAAVPDGCTKEAGDTVYYAPIQGDRIPTVKSVDDAFRLNGSNAAILVTEVEHYKIAWEARSDMVVPIFLGTHKSDDRSMAVWFTVVLDYSGVPKHGFITMKTQLQDEEDESWGVGPTEANDGITAFINRQFEKFQTQLKALYKDWPDA